MLEENKSLLEGAPTDTVDTAPVGEAAGTTNSNINSRLEYLENELKDVIKQRDELKKRIRKQEEDALREQGKYKELAETTGEKLVTVEKERDELLQVKEKYNTLESQIRADLLERLPEAKRKFADGFDIAKLREYTELEGTAAKVGTADAGRTGRGYLDASKVTYSDYLRFTPEQREMFAEQAPEKYKEFVQLKVRKL